MAKEKDKALKYIIETIQSWEDVDRAVEKDVALPSYLTVEAPTPLSKSQTL